MEQIIAREEQLKSLEKLYASKAAELLAIYGRRRIGKTFLINNFFQKKGPFFSITGVKGANVTTQLLHFAKALNRSLITGEPISPPKNWNDAFDLLWTAIEAMPPKKRIVLFFDELPWLASKCSGFLTAFDFFWNQYASKDPRLIVVICGSAAAWMIRNVIHSRGGLHGRVTKKIRLRPFTLRETETYLRSRDICFDRKSLAELYMCVGGVAQYLSQIEPGRSAAQAVQDLCFTEDGYLTREFYHIYASLFDNYEVHVSIVKLLAKQKRPLTRNEILKKLSLSSGGEVTKVLRELEESDLILSIPFFGKKEKAGHYQLIDPFTLFYLEWIEPIGREHLEKDYWVKHRQSQRFAAWAGHAFETLCLTHIGGVKQALGIGAVSTKNSQWTCRDAQIDLIIDRADGCINLCEMKFHREVFTVTKEYAKVLQRKKESFAKTTKTKKTLFTTLITVQGAHTGEHFFSAVDTQIALDTLFV